ncbi:MAG: hypothetical protein M3Z66_13850 [Chloroflexota bacterium]|nr:hypothetical protein [Chloroflexota bacterium]
MTRRTLSLLGLCVLMGGSGLLHFLVPAPYRSIIPVPLRGQAAALVAVSGVVEIICAMLLVVPRTRRLGAYSIAVLLVAVFPANIQMALDSKHGIAGILTWLRLPLQAPLILWALSFRRGPNGRG